MLQVRFWGTRGSSAPFQASVEFGCHTTCVEVRGERGEPVFIDLGTGIAPAAEAALVAGVREFTVFLTHLHLDHVCGSCAFAPLFRDDCSTILYSEHAGTREALRHVLSPPLFPVHYDGFGARVRLEELDDSGNLSLPERGLQVAWRPAAHPQGVTTLRFDDGDGNAFVFATDVELGLRAQNEALERLLREPFPATLAAIDGFFAKDDPAFRKNWGHSTWEQALEVAARNQVQRVVITHHNPRHTDAELRASEQASHGARWARDGQSWSIGNGHAQES
jgi:phosphoribosyl 1,2-cyclic phosphodiesterase